MVNRVTHSQDSCIIDFFFTLIIRVSFISILARVSLTVTILFFDQEIMFVIENLTVGVIKANNTKIKTFFLFCLTQGFIYLYAYVVSVCVRRRFPFGLLCDGVVCADLVALTENLQFEVLSFIDAHY